ncbi:MAG: CPBP family intramembrane metalloprotease [Chloroflexi bacterium]|nr:CPBP family intramembrane metalloprotease [Chloroflexota bacterium]
MVYLVAITVAEVVTVFYMPVWGVVIHIGVLVAAIFHSALTSSEHWRQLALSLALVPLVRIISLGLPLMSIPQVLWYPIIYAPLLAAAAVAMRALGYKLEQVGLVISFRSLPIQIAIALTGPVFGIMEYLILRPEGAVGGLGLGELWLPALLFLVTTGFVEEFIFRGVLQRGAVNAFGGWGLVYVSLLFAIAHVIHYSALDIVFVFAVALFFAWVVNKTGSLMGVTLSHGITNMVLYLIAPLLF